MTITMQNAERLTLAEMRELVEGGRAVEGTASGRAAIYDLRRRVWEARQYRRLGKGAQGIVGRFWGQLTGRSRAQLPRLIGPWVQRGPIQVRAVHQGHPEGQPGLDHIPAVDA